MPRTSATRVFHVWNVILSFNRWTTFRRTIYMTVYYCCCCFLVVGKELLHPWISSAICSASRGWGGHTAATGCCTQRSYATETIMFTFENCFFVGLFTSIICGACRVNAIFPTWNFYVKFGFFSPLIFITSVVLRGNDFELVVILCFLIIFGRFCIASKWLLF